MGDPVGLDLGGVVAYLTAVGLSDPEVLIKLRVIADTAMSAIRAERKTKESSHGQKNNPR